MKVDKDLYLKMRARNIGMDKAVKEFNSILARAKKQAEDIKKVQSCQVDDSTGTVITMKVKMYFDEFGREVHVNGPLIDRVKKVETLQEKIARFDRLAAQVRNSRQNMHLAFGDMMTDEEEDLEDDSLLDDTPIRDEFGDDITPVKRPETGVQAGEEPAAATSQSGVQPTAEPVSEPETAPAE